MPTQPNIVLIMTDQHRADVCAREGYPLDTTPFMDSLAAEGVWFNRAYTCSPTCAPARVSMLTGRFPSATRVRTNHNVPDATYSRDMIDVLREAGYATAMCGKNHSHLTEDRVDHWFPLGHAAGHRRPGRTAQEEAFDQYLASLGHRADFHAAPFPVECQGPARAVADAQQWVRSAKDRPLFLWLTFAEPHNPYQVPEPYFDMFPPDSLPPVRAGVEAIEGKGFKWQWTKWQGRTGFQDYERQLPRARSNYFGMLRLIDDQVKRFVEFLDAEGLREDTLIVFVADHGDFVGEYGLVRKGPEVPECLMRVPMFVNGPGIAGGAGPHPAHVSIVDIFPTLCEMIGAAMPDGVQGRSLWPLLTGGDYPVEEFASVYGEQGFGGLHYTADDDRDPGEEGAMRPGKGFDCLNSWTQSGTMRMLRKGDWKLAFDMQGRGQLYNLAADPAELDDLYGRPEVADIQRELLADLLAWTLRAADPLPLPRTRYAMKTDPRNWWARHR
ncbi:MAG TPA: sulfatase-like hydrolase/transferase [Phycisphaerae bacterium]|nr:sulfatase-like hydrolase/transferase [Phycisphaerae bacterium]